MLSADELLRYDRQIMVKGIGEEGQSRLKNAKVVIAGSGELGAPVALCLAAAGVGTIRIVDDGKVDLGHLNCQGLHWNKDIGRNKTDSLAEKLLQLNDNVQVETFAEAITENSVSELASGAGLIVDAAEDLPTRLLLNSVALQTGIAFIHGAVNGFEGRVTTILPGKTACVGCLYRGAAPPHKHPAIGVTPAVIGGVQATEAIKYILGIGQLLANRLLIYDGLRMRFTNLVIKKDPTCRYCRELANTPA